MPTRGLLAVETKDSFVLQLAKFKYKKNLFVNSEYRYTLSKLCPSIVCSLQSPVVMCVRWFSLFINNNIIRTAGLHNITQLFCPFFNNIFVVIANLQFSSQALFFAWENNKPQFSLLRAKTRTKNCEMKSYLSLLTVLQIFITCYIL